MELPSEDRSAGAREYAAAVVAALAVEGDDIVLVAHSLGGLTIPVVATMRPARKLVFVCALLPVPGRSFDDTADAEPDLFGSHIAHGEKVTGSDGVTRWEEPEDAIPVYYQDCLPSDAMLAASKLRGQTWRISQEITPLEAWPDIEVQFVACSDDRIVNPAWIARTARERFGIEAEMLQGGHTPMLAQPERLAEILTR
jgi:pimeloyl-ACP methyl ester carboxylesterase